MTSSSLELVVSGLDPIPRGGPDERDTHTAASQIAEEVTSWPGVEAGPGHRGEFAFKVGHREVGHLHGDRAAHFSFPEAVWEELSGEGRIEPHPVFPDKRGPAARRIETDADVTEVIALMRLNYDRIVAEHGIPAEAATR